MKVNYSAKYSGYIPVMRSVLLLVKNNIITLRQLATYIYLVMQADFDVRHKYYTVVVRSDKELAEELGLNTSTIYRHRKHLIKVGLLTEKNGITLVTNQYMFELMWVQKLAKLQPSTTQRFFTKHQDDVAFFETQIAYMQKLQSQNTTQSFNVPSKGKYSFSPVNKSSFNNEYTGLTSEDIKWLNENLKEEIKENEN